MIAKLMQYIAGVMTLVAIALGAWAWFQSGVSDSLRDDLEDVQASLSSCEARLADITEHKERTDEIDALPLDDLRERASEWLLDF